MSEAKEARQRVVVDGSNLATEGRSLPSLAQLDEAVRAFREEHLDDDIIVVVDASFSYRIDESERQILEEAEEAGEIVSPPAGAIGRGDGFLLRIADRTGAVVLSNDSFQEFHGDYKWLFEEGRLIGGKPVPGVGWIFTPRTPVRGPKSRVAVRDAERAKRRTKKPEEPVAEAIAEATAAAIEPSGPDPTKRGRKRGPATASPEAVNDPLPFITFIANHRLGSEVEGVVDSFTSHGAFVNADGARCYAPVVGLGDPPPRSAKEVLTRGESRTFVVQALDPPRRGIELALPGLARLAGKPTQETVEAEIDEIEDAPVAARARRRASAPVPMAAVAAEEAAPAKVPRSRKRPVAAPVAAPVAEPVAASAGEEAAAPAKRARRAPSKRAPIEEQAAAVVETAEVAEAKPARRRTTKKAAAAAPVAAGEIPMADTPALKRPPTRTASKRTATTTAPEAAPEAEAAPAPTPKAPAKRTRKSAAAPPSEVSTPAVEPPAPAETAPTRSGPRRSTIMKAAASANAPARSDPSAEAKPARPRRKAAKSTSAPEAPVPGDAAQVPTAKKARGSRKAAPSKTAGGAG